MDKTTNLKKLWHTVFHDDPPVIEAFFDAFPMEKLSITEYIGGRLAAAAFVLPFGDLVLSGVHTPCAHIYAVMVHPDFRGQGLGISITNAAVQKAKQLGFSSIVLHPADNGLFNFYSRHCGFVPAFTAKKQTFYIVSHATALKEAEVSEYIAARRSLLEGLPHIDLSENILRLFRRLGGRLYVFPGGCAAVEDSDGQAFFRELLGSVSSRQILSAMTASDKAVCMSPSPSGDGAFGMATGAPVPTGCWMGLALE